MRWEFERGRAHVGWWKGVCREMKREGFMEEGHLRSSGGVGWGSWGKRAPND